MSAMIATGVFVGAGQTKSIPQQLGAILYIPDLITPVNGYWQDKSGKGKLVQAATTTVANDSLIMPANDADIIAALTLAGAYSKYYTNNSTPKKVLISQVASIDAKYAVFFDAKTKTKFSLFKTQGDESRADKMYEFTFKAYTGGYFPITQTSDSVSFVIRGTGTHVFDWGDGTTTSYTLTTGADTTVSHTWSTNLGGQKNIIVTGSIKNWTKLMLNASNSNTCVRVTYMNLSYLYIVNCQNLKYTGNIDLMSNLSVLAINSSTLTEVKGSINGKNISYLDYMTSPLSLITGSIENCTAGAIINIRQGGITFNGGVAKNWTNISNINAGWDTAMLDLFLIAYNNAALTVASRSEYLAGDNQARSSNSDSAYASLASKGRNIKTNNNAFIFEGDSISGVISPKWPDILCTNLSKIESNRAIGGKQMSNNFGKLPLSFVETMGTCIANSTLINNTLFIAFGVNDIGFNIDVNTFKTNYELALNYLINNKGYTVSQIIIINIYYTKNLKLTTPPYNVALQDLAIQFNIKYIDVFTAMQNNGGDSLISADGIHPNATGTNYIESYIRSQL